ncbi:hypothetical protein HQ560_01145 [bacterium]|nr:hypothetical protein [bacterium]
MKLSFALLPLLCSLSLAMEGPTEYLLAYQGAPPTLDGKLDDACWNAASTGFPFLTVPSAYPAAEASFLMASFDGSRLAVAFDCRTADSEKLRAADGDLTLNDRVALVVRWPGADAFTLEVDAAGRCRGAEDVRVKTGRTKDSYVIELSLPKPADAEYVDVIVRRTNEVTGEVSAWGAPDSMGRVALSKDPGPAIKIRRFRRQPRGKETMTVSAANPLDRHVPVRCRLSLAEDTELLSHLLRLEAEQKMATFITYAGNHVSDTGMEIVIDEPQGARVYIRSRHFDVPPGRSRAPRLPVIPHPRKFKLGAEDTPPFVLKSNCRIVVGRKKNETERRAAKLLQSEIKRRFGIEVAIISRSYFIPYPSIVIATARTTLLAKRLAEKFELEWYEDSPSQTYVLGIRKDLIGIAGLNDVGTLYGVYTFLQLLDMGIAGGGMVGIPALTIRDHPDMPVRGMIWRSPPPYLAEARVALARYKVNLLTGLPEADQAAARADGILSGTLALPQDTGVTARRPPATLKIEPDPTMPRPVRRALRLPIILEEGHVDPPPEPTAEEIEAERLRLLEEQRKLIARKRLGRRSRGKGNTGAKPTSDPETVDPVIFAWVRSAPYALNDTAPNADDRDDVHGLCGGLTDTDSLLPPSWARVVATAEYGWSPNVPDPSVFNKIFYKSFYGAPEVGLARTYLERAAACLPRTTVLAALLTHDLAPPTPPRDDLPALVERVKTEAVKATRNQNLANLMILSGDRVLAAATNVRAALRVHALYAEAQALIRQSKPKDAAARCATMAATLSTARQSIEKRLGPNAPADDIATYRKAEEAAKKLETTVAAEGKVPPPGRFWPMLRGTAK